MGHMGGVIEIQGWSHTNTGGHAWSHKNMGHMGGVIEIQVDMGGVIEIQVDMGGVIMTHTQHIPKCSLALTNCESESS